MAVSKQAKIEELCDQYGYDDEVALGEAHICDSVCPAICMNEDCDYTTEMEPDQDRGYCEECETNSVKSLFILMGVI